jgi:hypothetical protein
MAQTIYQLKVSLEGANPPVWRRIQIAANVTLRQLHGVLQQAMKWGPGRHYRYCQDGREFGDHRGKPIYLEDDSRVSLRYCFCHRPGEKLEYLRGPWKQWIELETVTRAEGRFPWRMIDGGGEWPSKLTEAPSSARLAAPLH